MSTISVNIIPVTPFQQNCALIWDSETMVGSVIDPGGDVPKILEAITKAGVKVESIYLTHGHMDHVGGAAELAAALYNKPVIGPSMRDDFLLESLPEQGKNFGLHLKPLVPETWLREGDVVSIAGRDFSVLHCPGHTPGHVVFINKDINFGILGDVLFRNSIGRTDFPYGSHEDLIKAITTKLMVLPDEFQFICGHGQASSIGAERRSNPFLQ